MVLGQVWESTFILGLGPFLGAILVLGRVGNLRIPAIANQRNLVISCTKSVHCVMFILCAAGYFLVLTTSEVGMYTMYVCTVFIYPGSQPPF